MDEKTLEIIDRSDEFAVPLGMDPMGNPVRPFEAQKKIPYLCPECREHLVLRKGDVRAHHFSHRGDSECNPESRLHKSAKALVVKVVLEAISGIGKMPLMIADHARCLSRSSAQLLPNITNVQQEYRLQSGRILDVAILKGDQVRLGVEIYVTHRVGEQKKKDLTCPWIEVDAWHIVEDPLEWLCLAHDRVFPWCSVCGNREMAASVNPYTPPSNPYFLEPPKRLPYVQPSFPHATTAMPEKKVEMCIGRLPQVLDCFRPMERTLQLPAGGVVDPVQFCATIRSDLAGAEKLDIFQKKSLLWRTSEYLLAGKPWIKGATPAERQENDRLVNEAIEWLTK